MKKIAITGANGFIGKELCRQFYQSGWQVFALQRDISNEHTKGISYISFDLKNPVFDQWKDFDFVIHAAYFPFRKGNNSMDYNIKASKMLIDYCRSRKINFVHISSLSASPEALSVYGKTKYEIEKYLDAERELVIVPGLVIGKGGLFFSIYQLLKKFKILPLFAASKTTYTLSISDLCSATELLIDQNTKGKKYLFHPEAISQKEMYIMVAQTLNKKILFVPVLDFFAFLLFEMIELLPFYFGIGKENYLGIRQKIILENDEKFYLKNFDFLNTEKSIQELDK